MRARALSILVLLAIVAGSLAARPATAAAPAPTPAFAALGTYSTGLGEASAETVAFGARKLYVTNSADNSLDIVSASNPRALTLERRVDLSPYGAGPNSVAFARDIVAVAVEADPITAPGSVVFFDTNGSFLSKVTVGVLPDMITFTPNGRFLMVANEGQPSDDYSVDPHGSVSAIPTAGNIRRLRDRDVIQIGFAAFEQGGPMRRFFDPATRIFGPTAGAADAVQKNLEPEYIGFLPNGRTAVVSLQENNALAFISLARMKVDRIVALGVKDHSLAGNALDASDRDGPTVNIQSWPVYGLYQPDAIDSFGVGGAAYIISANEGDARAYSAFSEEARVRDLSLDPAAFPNAADLKANGALGRLTVTSAEGDSDGDGDFDRLHAFGARSLSIWSAAGRLVWDSGDFFERYTAAADPTTFNSNGDAGSFDTRSDNKGPEPEGAVVGRIDGRPYAFVAFERVGGVMMFDLSAPSAPRFVQYINNPGDIGPEVVKFYSVGPDDEPYLITANEISGTVTVYGKLDPNGAGTLTLLHNNDGESSLLPILNGVNGTQLPTGSVAAFKAVTDQQIAEARGLGNAVVNVYAGDAFLASATLACSLLGDPATTPVYDAVAQRQIAYDAHILGNHEFDFAPDFLERFIRTFRVNGVLSQPFLSANLDFGAEPGYADLIDADGLIVGQSSDGRVVSRALITTDEGTGQRFGIVSATTPALRTISSPRNVQILSSDLPTTAALVQAEIDRLQAVYGVRKIIFVSHLQDIANDRALIKLLRGVDIAVAGGGDELLANSPEQLLPGEAAPIVGAYPQTETDAAGRTVYLVTTAGNYKYLGRLDATFDARGEITSFNAASSFPRRVIPASPEATALGIADAVTPDPAIVASVNTPVSACLAGLQDPVASTEVPLDTSRAGSRGRETNMGNLIADGYLHTYDRLAASEGLPARDATVIAATNGGSIRQNAGDVLPVGGAVPGNITRQNTLDVMAFFTNLVTVVGDVSPADLKQILERSASNIGGGQFLQLGGLRVVVDRTRQAQVITTAGVVTTEGQRVISAQLADGTFIIQGGAVVPGAPSVDIVTTNFTAAGGDNYPWLRDNPNKTFFEVTYERSLVEYLLTFPVGASGLPTIPAGDARYAPGGEGRIVLQ